MPIRFTCPHCRQKLTVSTRKAGSGAECPRCKQALTIPQPPPPQPVAAVSPTSAAAEVESPAERDVQQAVLPQASAIEPQDAAEPDSPPIPDRSEPTARAQLGEAASSPSETDKFDLGFEGLELVYDTSEERGEAAPLPATSDLVAVPRYVVYLQGALLAVVALASFTMGMLAGGTLGGSAEPSGPQAGVIAGTVTFDSGNRQVPDEGAVVLAIPEGAPQPDEKMPLMGLRPGDPSPDSSHRGLTMLRQLGGGYARADAAGRFTIRVPESGRYLVLVLSHQRRSRSSQDVRTADVLKLGPYFEDASDLVAGHRYRLSTESVRGERELDVVFR